MNPFKGLATAIAVYVAVFLAGMALGWKLCDDHYLAGQAKGVEKAQARSVQAVDAGASAVAAVQTSQAVLTANEAAIDREITHARPALVRIPSCSGLPVARPLRLGGLVEPGAADQPLAEPGAPAASAVEGQAIPGPADLELTLGSVRLWNSALAGQSTAAGACPADDPAAPACAAGAGRRLTDLWRNHNVNASLCAQDRSQLAELIALLHRRQAIEQQDRP